MDEMLKKQDVLDAIYAAMEKTDKPDVVLGLAAAMSVVKKMGKLEQEPCDDAISRQAVLDLPRIKTHNTWGNVIKESVDVEDIRQLPPVNPAEKVGHWEWVQYDSNPNIGHWHCSECRIIIPHMPENTDNTPIYKWCPMCGVKMGGEQNG